MAKEAKAKGKQGQGPSFIVQKFDATDMGVKAGRAVLRGGTFLGLQYLGNIDAVKTKKIRKHMGWISIVLGLAGEMVIDDRNTAGRVVSGFAQGLTTWGMVDTTAQLLGEETRAKLGLSGLGANAYDSVPQNDNGIDWFAAADEADAMAQRQGADQPGASMAGVATRAESQGGLNIWNA